MFEILRLGRIFFRCKIQRGERFILTLTKYNTSYSYRLYLPILLPSLEMLIFLLWVYSSKERDHISYCWHMWLL